LRELGGAAARATAPRAAIRPRAFTLRVGSRCRGAVRGGGRRACRAVAPPLPATSGAGCC